MNITDPMDALFKMLGIPSSPKAQLQAFMDEAIEEARKELEEEFQKKYAGMEGEWGEREDAIRGDFAERCEDLADLIEGGGDGMSPKEMGKKIRGFAKKIRRGK